MVSATDYVVYQYNKNQNRWIEIADSAIIEKSDSSNVIVLTSTAPLIFAGKRNPLSSTTLYFDGGYVYSNTSKSVLNINVGIDKDTTDFIGISVIVKYLDFSTNDTGTIKTYKKECFIDSGIFEKNDQLISSGKMIVQEAGLIFTRADSTTQSCIYQCNPDIVINTGRSLVMQCKDSVSNFLYKSNGENRIILSSSPGSEVFESAGFGDGRILINSTSDDSLSYTYEYYLTDHLGSTRMVVNDQNIVNEAVMYHPYGTMVSVGNISSTLPVREKFTGKEFDEEGGSGAGISGMGLFYFGKRYYNPEVGGWISTDPADQYWNAYSYCGADPVNYIDPNGENAIVGMIIGGLIGGYAMGAISSGDLNPFNWRGSDWLGFTGGAIIGGGFGYGFGSLDVFSNFGSVLGTAFKTGYPLRVANAIYSIANTASSINNITQVASNSLKIKSELDNGAGGTVGSNTNFDSKVLEKMSWHYCNGVPPVALIDGNPIYVEDLMIGSGGIKNVGKNGINKLGKVAKGKYFRGGKKALRDNWGKYSKDKDFQKWWHREGKNNWGGMDAEMEDLNEIYKAWVEMGRPVPK